GRAARNVEGRAILYADCMTRSLERAVAETRRRRAIQEAYNREHGIVPQSITKEVRALIPEEMGLSRELEEVSLLVEEIAKREEDLERRIEILTQKMKEAAKRLEFEKAAILRDEIFRLRNLQRNRTSGGE
ncbi:MAG: UvrB/UvrC motif-containing protein, partial [Candidatus Caldatribacterium sp.]|nr:UvrB/UvrC motif-containing protein [Candidatus Caldatribacterium sp.]